jgi:dTMP kinase
MRARRRGRLVAVEGIDGAGKSTVVRALARELRRRGRSVGTRREPADRELGALAQRAGAADAWTGAVYFTIDRFRARPALERDLARHDLVVTDRSMFSTLAYQGSALPRAARVRLAELQRLATVVPDRVVLLELPTAEAKRRRGRRATGRTPLERDVIQRRVDAEYRRLARAGGWIVVDAAQPVPRIAREVADRLVGRRPVMARRRR